MTLLLILLGLLAGGFGSILGLGGGVLILPLTQVLLGFDALLAVGTTLVAVVFTAFSGSIAHFRAGNINFRGAVETGGGGIVGVALGSVIFKQYLTTNILIIKTLLGFFFLLVGLRMAWEYYLDLAAVEVKPKAGRRYLPDHMSGFLVLGFFSGLLTGTMGLGGGAVMVPGMIFFLSLSPLVAAGTTMLAMLPITVLGGIIKINQGFVDMPAAILLGLGCMIGAPLGLKAARYMKPRWIKMIFVLIFAYMSLSYLYPVFLHIFS